MKLEKINGFVFDMDGLMFDTERLVYEIWKKMMDERGLPYDSDDFKQTVGKRKLEVQNFYFGKYGADFPYWELSQTCRERYIEYISSEGIPVKKGLNEILDVIKGFGGKIAMATSTSRYTAELNIKVGGVAEYFDVLVCGDDVKNGKPHPEVFLTAANKLGFEPQECAAFEDSINGIKSAHAAGMTTFMVPDLIQPTEEIIPMIDFLCKDLSEAAEILR